MWKTTADQKMVRKSNSNATITPMRRITSKTIHRVEQLDLAIKAHTKTAKHSGVYNIMTEEQIEYFVKKKWGDGWYIDYY